MRKAFDETMKDPAFVAEAVKLNLEVDPMSGTDVADLVRKVNATPPDVVKRVRDALQSRGN